VHLELDEIGAGGIVREYSVAAETFPELLAIAEAAQFDFSTLLEFQLRLQRVGTLVVLDGQLTFGIKNMCGRCLDPFDLKIESSFALTFTPRKETSAEQEIEELELEDEELGLVYYEDERLDLLIPLQEQVVVSLPISPLCDEACRGLCPECGMNLNKTSCSCEKKIFNNKFASLGKLKIDS